MASLTLTAATTVAALKSEFNAAFGATLRVYNGGKVADDSVTLGELGLSVDGPFECRSSLTVDSFIERMKSEHNLKVKVYTCDGWVAVLGGLTLESAGKVKKNAVKADMESMIACQRADNSASDEYSVIKNEDGSYTVSINGVVQDNAKAAMRQIAEAIGLEYNLDWTTRQFGKKLSEELNRATSSFPSPISIKIENAQSAAETAIKAFNSRPKKTWPNAQLISKKFEDPFEDLMVCVHAGRFAQYVYTWGYKKIYPGGDHRRKPESKSVDGYSVHRYVRISKDFLISKYLVTQAQWKSIMGEDHNPSKKQSEQFPVTNISWNDIQVFIRLLNERTGKHYRLPTEAEWEFAARGGQDNKWQYAGCYDKTNLEEYAWDNEGGHNVGQKKTKYSWSV